MQQKHDYMELYPNLTKIIEMILCIPVSNAWPERGASKVRLVKTNMQNRLGKNMLQCLLQIGINEPELCSSKADELVKAYVDVWLKKAKAPHSTEAKLTVQWLPLVHQVLKAV